MNPVFFFPLVLLAACGGSETVHTVRGVYVGPASMAGAVTLDHERIPGVMEAMQMDFAVADTAGLGALRPGDKVRVRLVVPESGADRIEGFERLADTTRLALAPSMHAEHGAEASTAADSAALPAPSAR